MFLQRTPLHEFLGYLDNMYGVLGAFTNFFPMANQIYQIIPLPQPYPQLWFLFSALGCMYVVFNSFITSKIVTTEHVSQPHFGTAFWACIFYVEWAQIMASLQQILPLPSWIWMLVDASRNLLAPFLYVLTFYMLTKAFAIPAAYKWQQEQPKSKALISIVLIVIFVMTFVLAFSKRG